MSNYLDALQEVIDNVVAPAAPGVDRNGTFPRDAVAALGEAGLLSLTVSEQAGGGGQSLRQAAEVVRRLAEVCGSTAMVVLMHSDRGLAAVNVGIAGAAQAAAVEHASTRRYADGQALAEIQSVQHALAGLDIATGPHDS